MRAKTTNIAEQLSRYLRLQDKSAFLYLKFHPDNDFRVIFNRAELESEQDDPCMHTFVLVGERVPHPSITPDTCGFSFAHTVSVILYKKCVVDSGNRNQVIKDEEADDCLAFAESVQDWLNDGRSTATDKGLIEMDSTMNNQDALTQRQVYTEFLLTYG